MLDHDPIRLAIGRLGAYRPAVTNFIGKGVVRFIYSLFARWRRDRQAGRGSAEAVQSCLTYIFEDQFFSYVFVPTLLLLLSSSDLSL